MKNNEQIQKDVQEAIKWEPLLNAAEIGVTVKDGVVTLRGKAAICRQVRDAIVALTGLPNPDEVLGYFSGTDEAVLINERLAEAATWLAGFADLWLEE